MDLLKYGHIFVQMDSDLFKPVQVCSNMFTLDRMRLKLVIFAETHSNLLENVDSCSCNMLHLIKPTQLLKMVYIYSNMHKLILIHSDILKYTQNTLKQCFNRIRIAQVH